MTGGNSWRTVKTVALGGKSNYSVHALHLDVQQVGFRWSLTVETRGAIPGKNSRGFSSPPAITSSFKAKIRGGSGCYVGTRKLAAGIIELEPRVKMILPTIRFGSYRGERYDKNYVTNVETMNGLQDSNFQIARLITDWRIV